jgi:hypothetical protein
LGLSLTELFALHLRTKGRGGLYAPRGRRSLWLRWMLRGGFEPLA